MTDISIRPLERYEWQILRDFRLAALKATPGVFGSAYGKEIEHSPETWQDKIGGPGHQVFGLFADDHLIGITGVITWREDPSGESAFLVMSFIVPQYRGQGLSRLLYEARISWIRAHPQFKRIIVGHRASNEPSRRANQRHGFQFVKQLSHTWPDGSTEDELFYELLI